MFLAGQGVLATNPSFKNYNSILEFLNIFEGTIQHVHLRFVELFEIFYPARAGLQFILCLINVKKFTYRSNYCQSHSLIIIMVSLINVNWFAATSPYIVIARDVPIILAGAGK